MAPLDALKSVNPTDRASRIVYLSIWYEMSAASGARLTVPVQASDGLAGFSPGRGLDVQWYI
jgi:hypothetical protein